MIQAYTIECADKQIEIQVIDRVSIQYWPYDGSHKCVIAIQRPALIPNTRGNGTFYTDWGAATLTYETFESAPIGLLAALPSHDTWNIVARDDIPNGVSCLHIDGAKLIALLALVPARIFGDDDDCPDCQACSCEDRDWKNQVNDLRPTGR